MSDLSHPNEFEAYEAQRRTRVVFGANSIDRLGELVLQQGAQRAFLVTDPGLVAAGHVNRAEVALQGSGLEVRRFDGVPENPTSDDVEHCRQALGDWDAQVLVGFGGGSSIDVAKGCNFVRAGGGRMEDYWGEGKARGELIPLIAVPTTAGTGTEVQSFALIEQPGSHQKMACGDPKAAPVIALLDPTLTLTMPRMVTACTGLDAIGHAVETAVTKIRNPASHHYATEAFRLAHIHLPRVLSNPDDLAARTQMLKAATFAGIAIEHSMLGAAHSIANPLTAHYGVVHGQAVGMALPHVVRFNAADAETASIYATLARATNVCPEDTPEQGAVEALALRLEDLLVTTGFGGAWSRLSSLVDIPMLAAEAANQWTAQFNPRRVNTPEFTELFCTAFEA